MSYVSNQDLLKEFRSAERTLREAQADVRADTESPLARRIADHMRAWEEAIRLTLDEFEKGMEDPTANTFNQATPHGSPLERIQSHLPAPREPKDLATWSLQRHEELAEWCATLADQAISERTAELFQTLADRLRETNRQLAADTRSLEQG